MGAVLGLEEHNRLGLVSNPLGASPAAVSECFWFLSHELHPSLSPLVCHIIIIFLPHRID